MQESPVWPHWIQNALGWLASGVAGGLIVRIYTAWLNRKKPAAEIQLTTATATEVNVRAGSSAGDAVMRMMDRLDKAQSANDQLRAESQVIIDRLRTERDAWQDEYDKAFTERDEFLRQNGLLKEEIKSYENQIRTMRATLTLKDTNYDNTQDSKPPDYTLPSES